MNFLTGTVIIFLVILGISTFIFWIYKLVPWIVKKRTKDPGASKFLDIWEKFFVSFGKNIFATLPLNFLLTVLLSIGLDDSDVLLAALPLAPYLALCASIIFYKK